MLKLNTATQSYSCQYCGSKFSKEKTLFVHMCEKKRRHLAKNEKHVQIGYQTYVRFYQINQHQDKIKSYDEFVGSPYFNAFVKFGSFVSNVNPLYPDQYIDYIIKSGVGLDHWCSDSLYEKYVLYLIKTEPMEVALERTIKNMEKWADENKSSWNHYFDYVNVNRSVFDVKDGKISPWLLLISPKGKKLLGKFNDEQLTAVKDVIDPKFWSSKFSKNPDDLKLVRDVVERSQL